MKNINFPNLESIPSWNLPSLILRVTRRWVGWTSVSVVLLTVPLMPRVGVLAASADLSRSFRTNDQVVEGAIVTADTTKAGYVTLANDKGGQPLGVVTTASDSLIAINQQVGTVQIAVGGRAVALVSTLNGDIHSGDLIATSIINGVGAKAGQNAKIVGVAQQDFTASSKGATQETVHLSDGTTTKTVVGGVPIVIAIGAAVGNTSSNTSGLSGWVSSMIGRQVSMWQILLAGMIAFVGFLALILLVYGAITSGISAVGRNPLAKPTIFEALSQVMAMVSLIALSSISLMYLVLRI